MAATLPIEASSHKEMHMTVTLNHTGITVGDLDSAVALFTDLFAEPMADNDYRIYGRAGLTYKF